MEKYIELLSELPVDLLHIAQSYAIDNNSPFIEPAHFLRALLHKKAGLINFIEDTLDSDYYYLVDWSDVRMQQCSKSPYKMKGAELSNESKSVIKEASIISKKCGLTSINLPCILAALVTPGIAFSFDQLKTMPLTPEKIIEAISESSNGQSEKTLTKDHTKEFGIVSEYYTSLLEQVTELPIIGFEKEIRSLLEVLARKDRANVMIVGDTGVGKSSLIGKLMQIIKAQNIPVSLADIKPYELDLISLSQGVSYKGEIEDRLKDVLKELSENNQPILVIKNFHRIEDKQSILNGVLPRLKKALAKDRIQFICTTTIDGYTKDIEKDSELLVFFEKISIEEPSEDLAVEILKSKYESYEKFHNIKINDDVPVEIVRLAKRYMPERRLPYSALDLLDRAMASLKINNEFSGFNKSDDPTLVHTTLQKEDIKNVVSKMTGIPMGNIQSEERERLSNAEAILHKRVVGQNHAIKSVLDAIYESRSGLNKKGQPIGSFFFLGPTGTGKTELAKSLAEFLFNDDTSILRFDMSEYKEEHSVALLYGAPPGYVGYEEGGLLVNQIRQHPYSVVLFDEIEKAHKSVFDLFLQILDEGKLHDRLGRVGDFSNSLIIFTSNIGSDYIFKSFGENKIPTHDQMLEVMQGAFRPEFLARLTEIVPFSPITTEMIERIFDIHIKNLLRTLEEQNIKLNIDESAKNYITRVGFNAHYGARPILGIIRKEIRRPLSRLIISGDIKPGDKVTMKYNNEICWEISKDSKTE